MIAALPMYDRAETAAANDRFWALIRDAYGAGPAALTRSDDLWALWQSPELLLAQTCGYPLRARLWDRVKLVATPVLDLPDCPPGHYYSVIVVRRGSGDLRALDGADFAYNEPLSQSGWAAAHSWAGTQGLRFGRKIATGAHRASALAVAEGRAFWAAIDAVSWAMMRRYDRFTDALEVLATTHPTPALPYITALTGDAEALARALAAAVAGLPAADREILLLRGVTRLDLAAYRAIPNPPAPDA